METKQQLQQNLLEQDQRHKEEEEKLKKKIEEQDEKLGEQEKKLGDQEKKLGEQEKKLEEQEKKLGEHEKKLEEQDLASQLEKKFRVDLERELHELKKTFQDFESKVTTTIFHHHKRFEMKHFWAEKEKDKYNAWKSPAMYTNLGGYKFRIGVDANGWGGGRGKSIYVDLWAMPGEFDEQLKWPAKAEFTVELINQQGGQNVSYSRQSEWERPIRLIDKGSLRPHAYGFLDHINLRQFLYNDTLIFNVCDVKLL